MIERIKGNKMIIVLMVILLLILSSASMFFFLLEKENRYRQSQEDIENFKSEILKIQELLNDNNFTLEKLKYGNEYLLHNPLFEETLSFIEKDTETNATDVIENAKSIGLRCAYVQIIISEKLYVKESIGFETVDEGMVYFDIKNDYQVNPLIDSNYKECIIDGELQNEIYNNTIKDIIIIW